MKATENNRTVRDQRHPVIQVAPYLGLLIGL